MYSHLPCTFKQSSSSSGIHHTWHSRTKHMGPQGWTDFEPAHFTTIHLTPMSFFHVLTLKRLILLAFARARESILPLILTFIHLFRAMHHTVYGDGHKFDGRCMVRTWPVTHPYP